ncbi:MAG: tripartite tricarboxylate transporter substrate binding protein [Alphaproteobacteria bacterium]|nr:tripartite tricarboxylate transporter substrate binding protein [Alphaproteobacteria bacterium]
MIRLFAALLAAALGISSPTSAADYPVAPIRLVIPFPPGGPTDTFGRLLATALHEAWGQPVVPDNKPGATGTIGTAAVVKAPADGTTFLMAATSSHISPYLYQNQGYDPNGDLDPVVTVLTLPFFLAGNAAFPAQTLKELVAEVKRKPAQYSYASPGLGSGGHLVMEMFKRAAGLDIVHVPYKGSGPGIAALVAGEVMLAFDTVAPTRAHIAAGKLRGFAISGNTRSPAVPDVPTLIEAGYRDFDVFIWFGLFAPKGTPPAIVAKLNAEVARIMQTPAMRQRLDDLGATSTPQTPAAFRRFLVADTARWRKVITETGARAE